MTEKPNETEKTAKAGNSEKPIDYRTPAQRRGDRSRTNRANVLLIAALIAVALVFGATLLFG